MHVTLRNADDLLLALSPQDESSLGLTRPCVHSAVGFMDADFDTKELE